MIQLRREMEEAVEQEDYERASEIRDELLEIEQSGSIKPGATEGDSQA
jgi:protein arginine kinase activator